MWVTYRETKTRNIPKCGKQHLVTTRGDGYQSIRGIATPEIAFFLEIALVHGHSSSSEGLHQTAVERPTLT